MELVGGEFKSWEVLSLCLLAPGQVLKNSTPGKIAWIWQIEQVHIHPQIHFGGDVFCAVFVVLA